MSPTKGILLTPGGGTARKKNVTFGAHVLDNEEKRPMRAGLPDDCPGKFPSPWNKHAQIEPKRDASPDKSKGRSKLTEAFEQVRDESKKRKHRTDKPDNDEFEDDDELPTELAEPRSKDGKYWKHEYDIYRTNTQREVKKLITKQQAAKNFALMKDTQCSDLADQLSQEQRKVERLEAQTGELAALVQELQAELRANRLAEHGPRGVVAANAAKRQPGYLESSRAKVKDRSNSLTNSVAASISLGHRSLQTRAKSQGQIDSEPMGDEQNQAPTDPVQKPSEPYVATSLSEKQRSAMRGVKAKSKLGADDAQLKASDDIWAQLDSSANPVIARSGERLPVTKPKGFTVTSGTDATPLQALNINTLSHGTTRPSRSSPRSAHTEDELGTGLERVDSKDLSQGEPLESMAQPPSSMADGKQPSSHGKALSNTDASDAADTHIPASKSVPGTATGTTNNLKENVSPTSDDDINAKPSAVWISMHTASNGKRNANGLGKDRKEISQDRIEAARARIAARGRVAS